MDWVYTETVKQHFMNPRNILQDSEDFSEDGKGMVGNVQCGDQMMMLIRVDKETEKIIDCRWKTYGCASAIASTSVLSEMVKGMSLTQAFNLTPKDITAELGALPENKIHCSVLGDKALREAINDYYIRNNQPEKVHRDIAKVVCACMNVTDHEIEEAVLEGARTYLDLQERTKLGTVCGKCKNEANKLLKQFISEHFDT